MRGAEGLGPHVMMQPAQPTLKFRVGCAGRIIRCLCEETQAHGAHTTVWERRE